MISQSAESELKRVYVWSVRKTTVTGVPQPVIDSYEEVLCEPRVSDVSVDTEKYVEVHKLALGRTRSRTTFLDPLKDSGWLTHEPDSADGKWVVFVRCRIDSRSSETTDGCDHSYFRDMFPEERLKEYLGEVEQVGNRKKQEKKEKKGI